MLILCIYELGSPLESLSHLKQCCDQIRQSHQNVEIVLATKTDLENADISWADKAFITPAIKVKTSHDAHGFWRYLHATGWTDIGLRKANYEVWGALFNELNPDYILCAGSPSGLLMATLLGYKVIQVGNGQHMPHGASWPSECPFPELSGWIESITQIPLHLLLNKPGIVFCPRVADEPRKGAYFNVADQTPGSSNFTGQVLALWDIRHDLTAELIETATGLWGESFSLMSPDDFRMNYSGRAVEGSPVLILGNYDALSLSLAIEHNLPYLGSPLSRYQHSIASRCEASKLTFRLDRQLEILKAYDLDPYALQIHAQSRSNIGNSFSDLKALIEFLIN